MKLDLTHELRTLDGVVLLEQDEKPLTLRKILVNALLDPQQSKEIDGEEKAKRFNLSFELQAAKKYYEFNIDDSKLVKDLVGKVYTPLIVGQVWSILEKGHHPLTKKIDDKNGDNKDK